MRRMIAMSLVAVLAGCASGQQRPGSAGEFRNLPPVAQPSNVIATELAFARLAQEKGQWTAFREYAAKGATMFTPQPVDANDWLGGRADPPTAIAWQPRAVWSSCDGEYAITEGDWQNDGKTGWFSTVWQRQRNGSYKWILDQGGDGAGPIAASDFISAKVASCENKDDITAPALGVPTGGTKLLYAESADKTLRWVTRVEPDGSRYYAIEYWTGEAFERPIATNITADEN